MTKKILFAICLAILLLSFTVDRAEAHPRWYGPPWTWGYYEVHYYSWSPYYYQPCCYYWDPYWCEWDQYCWYDGYCDCCYYEPVFYYCYSPGWYWTFNISWGYYPYYYYRPYQYYHPPYHYHYYAWYEHHYPDYYGDGYGRWRGDYYGGHKPYRTNNYRGGSEYTYHNPEKGPKPPKNYREGNNRLALGEPTHGKGNLEIAKVGPVKNIRAPKKTIKRDVIPSVVKKSLDKDVSRIEEHHRYKAVEVSDEYPVNISKREPNSLSREGYVDKEADDGKGFGIHIKKKTNEKKKEENDNEKKTSSKKYSESQKRKYQEEKIKPSNSHMRSSNKGSSTSHPSHSRSSSKRSSPSGHKKVSRK